MSPHLAACFAAELFVAFAIMIIGAMVMLYRAVLAFSLEDERAGQGLLRSFGFMATFAITAAIVAAGLTAWAAFG